MKKLTGMLFGAVMAGAVMTVAAKAETVKIAFIDPLSGPFATTGTNGLAEWRYAADQLVNKESVV